MRRVATVTNVFAMLLCVVVLAVLGLGFYAMHKIKPPAAFRLRTTLLRVLSFSIEIESSNAARKPIDVPGRAQDAAPGHGHDLASADGPQDWESTRPQAPTRE